MVEKPFIIFLLTYIYINRELFQIRLYISLIAINYQIGGILMIFIILV